MKLTEVQINGHAVFVLEGISDGQMPKNQKAWHVVRTGVWMTRNRRIAFAAANFLGIQVTR